MKTQTQLLRKTVLAAAVALMVGGVASLDGYMGVGAGMSSFISTAAAAQGDGAGGGHKGGMGEGQGGQGGQGAGAGAGGQGQRGGKSMTDVLSAEADDDSDSDRPDWAGVPGRDDKPGGGNAGGSTKKGGDYGDLFVVLRDASGEPISAGGDEYYILLSDGTVVKTEDGEVPADSVALAVPVEFGRMNIARSPASVLEHSLIEALSKLDGLVVNVNTIAGLTDESGRLLTTDGLTIDSPLENLALYEALLTAETNDEGLLVITATSSHDGADTVYTLLVDPLVRLDLAASAIAASSDKTGDLTVDEIVLISSFMGVDDDLGDLVGDYSYDRNIYDTTVEVLVEQPDGSFLRTDVNLLTTVEFGTVLQPLLSESPVEPVLNPDGTVQLITDLTGIYLFTQAADDSVQVLEFVHDNEAP